MATVTFGREKTSWEKILDGISNVRRTALHWWTTREVATLARNLEYEYSGKRRSSVLGGMEFAYVTDKVVAQPFNFGLLKQYKLYHPFLSIVSGVISREITKRKIIPMPNFVRKCTQCGREYQAVIETCTCGGTTREPKESEHKRLKALLEEPNRQDEMRHIEESLVNDLIATGNAYIHAARVLGTNYELWNEDSEFMWIATDESAILGNDSYFCPNCDNTLYTKEQYAYYGEICPKCGNGLEEVAYIFKKQQMLSHYSKDEIIHFKRNSQSPYPYGWSDVIAVLLQLRSATAMTKFNYDNYSLAKMAMIIVHIGSNQAEANSLANAIEAEELRINREQREAGAVHKMLRTLHIGAKKGIEVIPAMPSPKDMQSLEWMDWWFIRMVAPQFGIQPIYINAGVQGGGGYFQRMEIAVNEDTILLWRRQIEEPLNESILPKINVSDWHMEHEPLQPIDRRMEAMTYSAQLAVLQQAAALGMNAKLDDSGKLFVSGEVDKKRMLELALAGVGGGDGTQTRFPQGPENPKEPRTEGDEPYQPGEGGTGFKPEGNGVPKSRDNR